MPTLSFTSVPLVNLLNVTSLSVQRKKIAQNAQLLDVNPLFYWSDMSHSSIAQVTMYSWLLCLLVLQSWTQLFCLSLEINHALNLKLVSIWLPSKSWSFNISLLFRIKSTWSSENKELLKNNTMILRSSLLVQLLKMPLLFLFLPNLSIT